MIIETKILGRRTSLERRPVELSDIVPDSPPNDTADKTCTLEQLLTMLVQHEVSQYNERQNSVIDDANAGADASDGTGTGKVGLLRVLTEQELSDGAAAGKIQIAPQARAKLADPHEALQVALQGFKDGLYYVFVDDKQIEDLNHALKLREESTVLLLRLVALAGG